MTLTTKPRATVQDLYNVPESGKAELVAGELVLLRPTGAFPGRASGEIYVSLRLHEKQIGGGHALPDNVGFLVQLPRRESFSPDAAWYVGDVSGMKFLPNAPLFAVEVRSENDYGAKAARALAAKIADYFAAGTLVVWDVDLRSEAVVTKHTARDSNPPLVFRRDEIADAEPAVSGWRLAVNDLFV